MFSNVFLLTSYLHMLLYIFKKMLPSAAVITRGLCLRYDKSSNYIFCNKHFKAFLEGQLYRKINCFACNKKAIYSFDMVACHLFYVYSSFSVQYSGVFLKKRCAWYLKKCWFFSCHSPQSTSSNNILKVKKY